MASLLAAFSYRSRSRSASAKSAAGSGVGRHADAAASARRTLAAARRRLALKRRRPPDRDGSISVLSVRAGRRPRVPADDRRGVLHARRAILESPSERPVLAAVAVLRAVPVPMAAALVAEKADRSSAQHAIRQRPRHVLVGDVGRRDVLYRLLQPRVGGLAGGRNAPEGRHPLDDGSLQLLRLVDVDHVARLQLPGLLEQRTKDLFSGLDDP